ncbi:MAG: GrpB family protein [Akkermansiaceae bacterium]
MKIEVVPYNQEWSKAFEEEKKVLLGAVDQVAVEVHHIGSTAVEGLAAKPIIDIMLEVTSLAKLDDCKENIEALGYEALDEFGIMGRRYYRKGEDHRTHQIHAFQTFDGNLTRHLAFRDYLRNHPDVRDEYGNLKTQVASLCDDDIDRYCDGKNDFIKLHEAKALEWISLG